jgi:ABC-type multidrug transport system permease subunit
MSTTKTVKPARKRRAKAKANDTLREMQPELTFLLIFVTILCAVVYFGGGALLLYGFLNWLGLWPLF